MVVMWFLLHWRDVITFALSAVFAWESSDKGVNTHMQSDPTKLHFLMKQFAQKKTEMGSQKKRLVLEKYGGEEHLEAPPRELLLGQSVPYSHLFCTYNILLG